MNSSKVIIAIHLKFGEKRPCVKVNWLVHFLFFDNFRYYAGFRKSGHILLRFRTHPVAVIADIEKAFLMVSVTYIGAKFLKSGIGTKYPRMSGENFCLDHTHPLLIATPTN